jgi:CBS domain containing-hemolysin-like protein
VYSKDRRNVVGFIKLKKLLVFKGAPNKTLKESNVVQPITKLNENMTLLDAVDQLKAKNMNFAMVYDQNNARATGMITLKKIFELLVLREFLDDDNQAQYRWQQPGEHY